MTILATIFVLAIISPAMPAHARALALLQADASSSSGPASTAAQEAPKQMQSSPAENNGDQVKTNQVQSDQAQSNPRGKEPIETQKPEVSKKQQLKTQRQSSKPAKAAASKAKKTKTHSTGKSKADKGAAEGSASTIVVKHGSAPEPALKFAPTLTQEQLAQQRQHTTELLAASDANLKNTSGRQLNPAQQDTVSKVRNYMQQATVADKSGDVQRAQALASKAKQLSDDLVSH